MLALAATVLHIILQSKQAKTAEPVVTGSLLYTPLSLDLMRPSEWHRSANEGSKKYFTPDNYIGYLNCQYII